MKWRILGIAGGIIAVIAVVFGFLLSPKLVRLENAKSGEAIYTYNDADKISDLSTEELRIIQKLFNNKIATRDELYCGFSKDVCMVIDENMTFCFAGDRCPIVYWVEADRYFSISEKEQDELLTLLESHGFKFPCV